MKSLESKIAQGISVITHPLLMPTYISILIFNTDKYLRYGIGGNVIWNLVGLIFVLTFMFPASSILILKYFGYIESVQLKERKERTLPYLITCVFFYFSYQLLSRFSLPVVIYLVLIGGAISVLLTMIINFWWKISAHMMGVGCVVGVFLALNGKYGISSPWLIMCCIMLSGITGYARLKLHAHNSVQIYTGFLLGLLSMFSLFIFI